MKHKILIVLVFLLAAFLRIIGLDWDNGHHLHPDERFLTMVTTAIEIPESFSEYLDPELSTMNPYNKGYDFFVYGTTPIYLTKIIGQFVNKTDYGNVHFVGRILSSLFDLTVVFLVFKLVLSLFNFKIAILASFLYAIMVFPIQQSHFYTVDTFLNTFLLSSFVSLFLFIKKPKQLIFLVASSIFFGMALSTKISALYFVPVLGLLFLYYLTRLKPRHRFNQLFFFGLLFLLTAIFTLRFLQPSMFAESSLLNWQINPKFIDNIKQLESFNQPGSWFPPSLQWENTTPLLFPLKNIVLWGLGLPIGIAFILSVFYSFIFVKQKENNKLQRLILGVSLFWILLLITYQGTQYIKTMRYFLPIYPFIAIISSVFLNKLFSKYKKLLLPFLAIALIYPVSFMFIYAKPVTRLAASNWIYNNVPAGSVVANEHWDDPLPLNLKNKISSVYPGEMLSLYDQDTPEKWSIINSQLERTDFIILSSNRLYGTIPNNPDRYPEASTYYQRLFDGSLGFTKVAEFTSYPCFPPISTHWFCFNDDSAEEAFTVYDHPKVLIFQKTKI